MKMETIAQMFTILLIITMLCCKKEASEKITPECPYQYSIRKWLKAGDSVILPICRKADPNCYLCRNTVSDTVILKYRNRTHYMDEYYFYHFDWYTKSDNHKDSTTLYYPSYGWSVTSWGGAEAADRIDGADSTYVRFYATFNYK